MTQTADTTFQNVAASRGSPTATLFTVLSFANELLCLLSPHSTFLLRGVGRSADARPLPPLDPTPLFSVLSILFEPLAAMSNAVKPPSGHLSITEEQRRGRAAEKAGQKREQGRLRAQAGTLSGNLRSNYYMI